MKLSERVHSFSTKRTHGAADDCHYRPNYFLLSTIFRKDEKGARDLDLSADAACSTWSRDPRPINKRLPMTGPFGPLFIIISVCSTTRSRCRPECFLISEKVGGERPHQPINDHLYANFYSNSTKFRCFQFQTWSQVQTQLNSAALNWQSPRSFGLPVSTADYSAPLQVS